MRLVHFSDWHWSFGKLPEADLYVCTGDMLTNFPVANPAFACDYQIDRRHEQRMQPKAIALFVAKAGFSKLLGSPAAPIVCVRGNHDFVPIAPLFTGCGPVTEIVCNEVVTVAGLRITGHRGVPTINGSWNDETPRGDLMDRLRAMPAADVYVTHYPPAGVLDGVGVHYGLEGAANELVYRHSAVHGLHCFGHVHECGGTVQVTGSFTFSNAATTYNVLEGDPTIGWVDVSPL